MGHRERVEAWAEQVTDNLLRYLSTDKKHVSAAKIAGLLGISNVDSYAVKANVEDSLSRVLPEIEKKERDGKPYRDWEEYATECMEQEAKIAKQRAELPIESPNSSVKE